MMKTAMIVSVLALSAPALAQQQTAPGRTPVTTAPAMPQTAPTSDAAEAATAQSPTVAASGAPTAGTPVTNQTAPGETAAAPGPQATPSAAVPAETAAAPAPTAQPVTGATQIAQVVETEFPTYDKNADTNLDKAEFGAWMVALKTASDPKTRAADPTTVTWIDGAFVSADTDKSRKVSKDELTKYLSQGAE